MIQSLWKSSLELPEFQPLYGDHRTEVLIIGGGLCGVLCAYFLEQAGIDYMLVEADRIGSGVTGCTSAKITSQHGLIYEKMIRTAGRERSRCYLQANERALKKYRELSEKADFGFETKDAYIYSVTDRRKIEREVEAVCSLGFAAEYADDLPLPLQTQGAVRFPNQAQFHPLRFLSFLVNGLTVYEHTKIFELAPHRASYRRTLDFHAAEIGRYNRNDESGVIQADRIIVATHFPFLNKHGSFFLKLYQHRSYMVALKGAQNVNGMYLDEAQNGFSFRNYQDFLLLGGGGHRTGKQQGGWQKLRQSASVWYPHAAEKYAWATQDCMSLDGIPYIGQYSRRTPDLYVASGFHKWGMTSAMVAAQLLCDRILGKDEEWHEIFSPSRSIWKPQLFLNGAEAVSNLLAPTTKRCPHLGCALKWNAHEHTWDCPCHGSRFEEDGKLINNPATGDAVVK